MRGAVVKVIAGLSPGFGSSFGCGIAVVIMGGALLTLAVLIL